VNERVLQVFAGNVDSYQVKHAYLDEPIIGRYVKFHTVSWNRHPSMRIEVIGCQGPCFSSIQQTPSVSLSFTLSPIIIIIIDSVFSTRFGPLATNGLVFNFFVAFNPRDLYYRG